jgi:GT2 family glycosyltransferase
VKEIAVSFPAGSHVTSVFTGSLAAMCCSTSSLYHIDRIIYYTSCYVHVNRNKIVRKFLQSKAEWLLQLDPDLRFKQDLIQRLVILADKKQAKFVAGWYPNLTEMETGEPNFIPLVFSRDEDTKYRPMLEVIKAVEPMTADAVATGCIMVHREVYEKVEKEGPNPWFDFEETDRGTELGEDIFFSKTVREAGYEIWVDPLLRLEHYKTRAI